MSLVPRTLRLALAASLFATACPAPGQTLPELLRILVDKHPDLVRAQLAIDAAREQVKQAYSPFLPRIGVQYDQARATNRLLGINTAQETRQTAAFVQWNLFNGGGDVARLNATESGKAAAESDLEDLREELALSLTEAYMNVVTADRQVLNAQMLVKDLAALAETVRARVDSGASADNELLQATSKLLQAKNSLALAQGRYAGSRNRLSALVGERVTWVVDPILSSELAVRRLDELVSLATAVNPQVRSAESRVRAASADMRSARAEFLPKLQFEARKNLTLEGPNQLQSGLERESLFTVTYIIPLGGSTYFRWTELAARRAAAEATIETVKLKIRAELGETREILLEQRAIARQIEERVAASVRVFDAYRLQYDAGKRSLIDLILVREDQYAGQEALITNLSEQRVGAARLHRGLGQLRAVLLDPEAANKSLAGLTLDTANEAPHSIR
ncbi:MAG: TolC family protein [Burkholderiales bacterium]